MIREGMRALVLDEDDRILLVRLAAFDPRPTVEVTAEEVDGFRWWTLDELGASEQVVYPARVAALLRDLLEAGVPPEPVELEP